MGTGQYGTFNGVTYNKPDAKNPYGSYSTTNNPTVNNQNPTPQSPLSIYEGIGNANGNQDPEYLNAQDKLMNPDKYVNQNEIRSNIIAGMQDRINAINQIYNQQLSKAKQEGLGRVGQTTAILANRGLAGSMRGGTLAENTLEQNRGIESAIDAQRNVEIQALYGKADEMAIAEAQRRREALQGGAKNYLDFIKNQEIEKGNNINKIAQIALANGMNLDTMTPEQITQALKPLIDKGYKVGDILTAYNTEKKKQAEELAKNFPSKELSQGESLMIYNPKTGKYEQQGYNPKTYSPNSTGVNTGTNLTSKQYTALNQITTKFQADPIINQSLKGNTASIIADQIIANPSSATNQLKSLYVLVKNLDPDSAVREGELALANQTQSYLQQFGNTLARITAGRVVSPQAATELAKATKELMGAWNQTATKRQQQYNSQASILGLGNEFSTYIAGSNLGYNNQSNNDPLGIR